MTYFSYINNVKKNSMNTNNKLNKANSYRLSQELLRNKALKNGVNLIAPETVYLSNPNFGSNRHENPKSAILTYKSFVSADSSKIFSGFKSR